MIAESYLHERLKNDELELKKAETRLQNLSHKNRYDSRGYHCAIHHEMVRFIAVLETEINLIKEILEFDTDAATDPERFVHADSIWHKHTNNMLARLQVYPGIRRPRL